MMKRRNRKKKTKININYQYSNKESKKKRKKGYSRKIQIISKLIILMILLFFIFILQKYRNKISIDDIPNISKKIIESKYYESFENIKLRYINNTVFNPYLEKITIISHIYNENYKILKRHKTSIDICVSLDNKYIYIQLVSIESVLVNCNKNKTYLIYHILCSPDVTENSIFLLKSLVNKYPFNLEMIFYNMSNSFMSLYVPTIPEPKFYRVSAPIIIDVDRIIHLDGDTLTLKDLTKMYNLDFNDNYILGFLDYLSDDIDYLGINSTKYINTGVILINLEKMRNDNKIVDLFNFINKKVKLKRWDQTILNYVLYPNIGSLSSEFVIFNFYDELDIRKYSSFLRTKVNTSEIIESLKSPTVIHSILCWPKIWDVKTIYQPSFSACDQRGNCSCEKYQNLWYFYANKTDYYEEILHYTHYTGKNRLILTSN